MFSFPRMTIISPGLWIFFLVYIPVSASCQKIIGENPVVVVSGEYPEKYRQHVHNVALERARIVTAMTGSPPGKQVTILLTKHRDDFRKITGGSIPDWGIAVALGDSLIVLSPLEGMKYDLGHILAHEIVHCFIEEASRGTFVPRWFHEGTAQAIAGEWGIRNELVMAWRANRGTLLSFTDIEWVFSADRVNVGLAYDQSMLAVHRLISIHGTKVIADILSGMRSGREFPDAFETATGLWPSEFETDYLTFVRKTYGRTSLYTLIPGTWLLVTAVAFAVYIIKRKRTKKLMQTWELEDEERIREGILLFPSYSAEPGDQSSNENNSPNNDRDDTEDW